MSILRGSIVWIAADDPNGKPILDQYGKPKSRPTMVVTSTADIQAGVPIIAVAISSRFDIKNLPTCWFSIPSHPNGHPVTGLDQPSVVKADWPVPIIPAKITRADERERAPTQVVKQVLNWIAQNP